MAKQKRPRGRPPRRAAVGDDEIEEELDRELEGKMRQTNTVMDEEEGDSE